MKKLALVIGASGGIGSSLSEELGRREWNLHFSARNEELLGKMAEHYSARYTCADVTKSESVQQLFHSLELDEVDHLAVALCVGSILLKPAHLTTDEDWQNTLSLNLTSAFFVLRELAKIRDIKSRSLLFFSSAAAQVGLKNHEAIAAAKAGLIGLAKSAASSYGQRGLRVNVISPGLVETPLSAHLLEKEASRKASESMHPLGRLGKPEDISIFAADFLEPSASWLSGQVLGIDGGLSSLR